MLIEFQVRKMITQGHYLHEITRHLNVNASLVKRIKAKMKTESGRPRKRTKLIRGPEHWYQGKGIGCPS